MKKTFLFMTMLISQMSSASIINSTLEERHQKLVVESISKNCGKMRNLTEISSTTEIIQIDNGIQDAKYVTLFFGEQRMDQNIFDTYTITVKSEYADMYDQTAREWGFYSVSSVECIMQ